MTASTSLRIQAVFPQAVVDSGSGTWTSFRRLQPRWRELGVELELVTAGSDPANHCEAIVARWQVARPAILHLELPSALASALQGPARAHGIPISAAFHHIMAHAPRELAPRILGSMLDFYSGCDHAVAESQSSMRLAVALGLRQVSSIHRGVGAWCTRGRRAPALRASWGVAEDACVVLWVGRLIPAKDPCALARIWPAIAAHHPAARLVIVGNGPEGEAVRRALPEARVLPWQDDARLADIYASADIFLHTAPAEPAGNVMLEAAATGLPVIGRSGSNLIEELVPHAAGIQAPTDSDLSTALRRLLADPGLRHAMGAAGRERAAALTEKATAAGWHRLWQHLHQQTGR